MNILNTVIHKYTDVVMFWVLDFKEFLLEVKHRILKSCLYEVLGIEKHAFRGRYLSHCLVSVSTASHIWKI